MEHASLVPKIAEVILEGPRCVRCIVIDLGVSTQAVLQALPTLGTVLTVRITSLAQCRACGRRNAVTYSFSRARPSLED